jgi:hypothetical protein
LGKKLLYTSRKTTQTMKVIVLIGKTIIGKTFRTVLNAE